MSEIILYQPPQVFELINISPFCAKLETFLRMTGLNYEVEVVTPKTFAQAPNGKVPWVRVDGKMLPDSSLIIDYLQETHQINLAETYSAEEKAIATAVQRLIEEHLYWGMGYFRWTENATWPETVLSIFMPNLPFKAVISRFMKYTFVKQMKTHGLARHEPDTVLDMCRDDLEVLSVQLGDKPFFFGDNPSLIDCTVFGFLDGIVRDPTSSRLQALAKNYGNLDAYCQRMGEKYFPELYR